MVPPHASKFQPLDGHRYAQTAVRSRRSPARAWARDLDASTQPTRDSPMMNAAIRGCSGSGAVRSVQRLCDQVPRSNSTPESRFGGTAQPNGGGMIGLTRRSWAGDGLRRARRVGQTRRVRRQDPRWQRWWAAMRSQKVQVRCPRPVCSAGSPSRSGTKQWRGIVSGCSPRGHRRDDRVSECRV